MITLRTIETALCRVRCGVTNDGVCLVELGSDERGDREIQELETLLGCSSAEGDHPLLDRLADELAAYFDGALTAFTVPVVTPGTEWQTRVWDALHAIPYGETTTYGELAARLGNPGGARAVGLANGANRVSVLVPCHRVIAGDGTLHGYGGGVERKRWLLDHEATHVGANLFTHATRP